MQDLYKRWAHSKRHMRWAFETSSRRRQQYAAVVQVILTSTLTSRVAHKTTPASCYNSWRDSQYESHSVNDITPGMIPNMTLEWFLAWLLLWFLIGLLLSFCYDSWRESSYVFVAARLLKPEISIWPFWIESVLIELPAAPLKNLDACMFTPFAAFTDKANHREDCNKQRA